MECQACVLDNIFQHSTTSIDTKKCSPAIVTWEVARLDITLATNRKCLIDSHHDNYINLGLGLFSHILMFSCNLFL